MSEKDVLGAFLLVNNPIVLSEEEIKDVQKAIKQLQQRIDKAIEYIEDNSDDMHTYISQAITQILKGSDKE